jgi:hypothetical protein
VRKLSEVSATRPYNIPANFDKGTGDEGDEEVKRSRRKPDREGGCRVVKKLSQRAANIAVPGLERPIGKISLSLADVAQAS